MKTWIRLAGVFSVFLLLSGNVYASPSIAQGFPLALIGVTEIISVSTIGNQANQGSIIPSVSADGRYVVFYSEATNLVWYDTNNVGDIFLHDRVTGETTRVSVSTEGWQARDYSSNPVISADGNNITFESYADNLVPGDTNGTSDIFVKDRVTGEITRISVASDGSQADCSSYEPAISADGRYVAFNSCATNMVPGDVNNFLDIFVHDRDTGQTTLVSVSGNGGRANNFSGYPTISADGRFITFSSFADNLVSGDTNLCWWINQYIDCPDIFVHDILTGETERVSIATDGTQGDDFSWGQSAVTTDGRSVFFRSSSTNLVGGDTNAWPDIFLRDRATGETTRVSVAADGSQAEHGADGLSISPDGRYLAFSSSSSNLVEGDTNFASDVFLRDLLTGEVTRVSMGNYGETWDDSCCASISPDIRYVVFASDASNLVIGDENMERDIFLSDRLGEVITYTISGTVTDLEGSPLSGVTVTNSNSGSVLTDDQGYFSFTGLDSGIYHISPSLGEYFFSPFRHTVSVPPSRTSIDFHQVIPTYTYLPIISHYGFFNR